jgi:hypothetical protein
LSLVEILFAIREIHFATCLGGWSDTVGGRAPRTHDRLVLALPCHRMAVKLSYKRWSNSTQHGTSNHSEELCTKFEVPPACVFAGVRD